MGKPLPSVPYFSFAQGMLALFPATVTALILLAKDTLTGGGVWISLVNSFVAGGVCGLVLGTVYNLLGRPAEGSRFLGAIFTASMILVTLAIGITIPRLTAKYNATLIWRWNP